MKAIINGKIIGREKIIENSVILYDKVIRKIVPEPEVNLNLMDTVIDAKGNYISPGLIDIHIHGSNGSDVMDATHEAIETISRSITASGVTSFLAATMTMESANILKALNNVRESLKKGTSGAELLGVHLEGPFINEKYKGAQNAEYILKPDYKFVKNYMDIIKIITYAPEKDENYEFTKCMCKEHKHIALSIGHSAATYEQAMGAIKNGARHITHIFNAMPSMHHREPGIIGAAFRSDVTCELIADNIHVNPENYQILIGIKGKDKVVLITDSMRAGCLKSGEYELGGQKVNVDNTSARLESGTLAGSILTLNKGVQNVLNYADVNIIEAVNMASINAAKVIGIDNIKGSLEEGKDADIIILDSELKVKKTIVGGNIVYEN